MFLLINQPNEMKGRRAKTGTMNNRFENFVISVLRLNKIITKIKLLEMEEYKLRAVHVMCIYYLSESEDGLTATELARLTLEDKAAISRALGTLRERGYITYDSKKYNSKVQLTDEGKNVAEFINERAENYVDAAGGTLSESDREAMYRSLATIIARLEAYYESLARERGKDPEQ